MVKELEVKILHIDPEEMINRLRALGAIDLGEEQQVNYLLSSPYFEEHVSEGSYLRIRERIESEQHFYELTLKELKINKMLRENQEYTVAIDDVKALEKILSALGVYLVSKGEKLRRSFLWSNARFDIDIWDRATYPYPYMEIEVNCEEDLYPILEALEISEEQVSRLSIVELQNELKR